MKISLKWLNDFVDVKEYFQKPESLSEILTRAGLEVEDMQDRAKDLKAVVIGHIQVKDKHPNADKLSLCQVDVGQGSVLQIVCGAQNHKSGDKVVVALPGAILPGNFAIKKSAIRGVESSGMLCSLKELGLATESEGIQILPPSAPTGQAYASWAGLDDIVFELKVTPNRADCLSHYGLAREVSCLLNKPLKELKPEFKEISESTQNQISLSVQEPELCPRYGGRYIKNVQIKESPDWLKQRLEAVGMNSINNVVDVTNYVMMELGQPLHAFDADQLAKRQILVKKAQKGEKFKTLQEVELTLQGDELMICDGEKAVALAGVVGGLNSGVSEKTQNIFLEAAHFMSMAVRKTARKHGVETDSAYRFARGVNISTLKLAMDRATELLQQVAGGEVLSQPHDFYPHPVSKKPIHIQLQTVTDRLGYPAHGDLFVTYMKGLGCQVKELGGGTYEVLPPMFRFDLEMDMDLVEEYARLHGYENITESLPAFAALPSQHDKGYVFATALARALRADGYSQCFNYAFTAEKKQSEFLGDRRVLEAVGLPTGLQDISILNPLNEELNVMRASLSLGLYQNAIHNFHQGQMVGRLFEIGKSFVKADSNYNESSRLGIVAWGQSTQLWQPTHQHELIFEVKSVLENLMRDLKIQAYSFVQKDIQSPAFTHPGQCAVILVEGKKVGFMATVHPAHLEKDKIRVPMVLAELDLDKLMSGGSRPLRFKSVVRFPVIERDFSFVMDENVAVGDVQKEIQKVCGAQLLKQVDVFDLYVGDKLPSGKKSVSFRLRLQSDSGTLQDEAVNELSQKLIESLNKQFALTIR